MTVEQISINNPPVFRQEIYTFEIAENVGDTFVIGSLGVTDESKLRITIYVYSYILP